MLRTNRQTNKRTNKQTVPSILPTPTDSVGVYKNKKAYRTRRTIRAGDLNNVKAVQI